MLTVVSYVAYMPTNGDELVACPFIARRAVVYFVGSPLPSDAVSVRRRPLVTVVRAANGTRVAATECTRVCIIVELDSVYEWMNVVFVFFCTTAVMLEVSKHLKFRLQQVIL
jgi:hypothetical protein